MLKDHYEQNVDYFLLMTRMTSVFVENKFIFSLSLSFYLCVFKNVDEMNSFSQTDPLDIDLLTWHVSVNFVSFV